MTEDQFIQELINAGESDEIEFVSVADKADIGKYISSFLNTKGGKVVVGINSAKILTGVDKAKSIVEKLKKYLLKEITPEAPITISREAFQNKELIILKVYAGSKPPYIFDGTIFYRKNKETVKATTKEISALIHDRQKASIHWERQSVVNFEYEDLDKKLILATIQESRENHRSNFYSDDIYDFLEYYGLYENGYFTNACVILFAKNPARFIPQIRVRLTEYGDNKTGDSLFRDEVYDGNFFDTQNKLEKYISNLGVRSAFSSNRWKRVDFKFPEKALQEGIINALMHRDYSSPSSGVSIGIYPDKIIISNSGHLPNDLKASQLKKNHRSHPVNPDIAHIVFLRGLIDKLGRGTLKVVSECQREGLKDPVWKDNSDGVSLTFNGPKALPSRKQVINVNFKDSLESLNDGNDDGNNDGNNNIAESVYYALLEVIEEASHDGKIDGIGTKIINELATIVQLLHYHGELTTSEIVDSMDKSKPTIERYISLAKKIGLIDYKGTRRQGNYFITPNLSKKINSKGLSL